MTDAQCPRCRAAVVTVVEAIPFRIDIDDRPVRAGDTAPYYRRPEAGLNGGKWIQTMHRDIDQARPVHHCPAPHRCRWCEQVHQPPTATAGRVSNNNGNEATA